MGEGQRAKVSNLFGGALTAKTTWRAAPPARAT
jgi:hypothetical protein